MKNGNLTAAEAERLYRACKIIDTDESSVRFRFSPGKPSVCFNVVSTDLPKQEHFLLTIRKSEKKLAKITFHHMHEDTYQCLLRVDINGTHKNPDTASESVPSKFLKYAGAILRQSHAHFYIEDYGDLWALPLNETEFKDWETFSNIEDAIQGMLNTFCNCISLSTPIIYDQELPL